MATSTGAGGLRPAWRVVAGSTEGRLRLAATADRADFVTAVTVASLGRYFQVVAGDRAGLEFGRSACRLWVQAGVAGPAKLAGGAPSGAASHALGAGPKWP
jgi:hypothetical protein